MANQPVLCITNAAASCVSKQSSDCATCKMPPKRTRSLVKTPAGQVSAQTQANIEHCALCCHKIVQNKEDVLFCTGKCNGPIHRYCLGVFVLLLEEMKTTSATATAPIPGTKRVQFLCLVSTQQAQKEEVHELKSIIAA